MTTGSPSPDPPRASPIGVAVLSVAVALTLALCILFPVAGVAFSLARLAEPADTTSTHPFSAASVATTLFVSLTIALLATALALPAAWSLRGEGASARWTALLAVPLLMPAYLAYSGWGVLRAPGSWLGDWLSRGDPIRVIIADRALAIAGLALWSWPIAALLVGSSTRRLPQSLIDALALQPATRLRKALVISRLLAPSITTSIALIALIMAGSAIPLHLAQIQTYSIHLWKFISLTPEPVRAWLAAWPLLLLALIAAAVCVRSCGRSRIALEDLGDPRSAARDRRSRAAAVVIWCLSVPAPLALFARSLHSPASLVTFWHESGPAVAHSALNAAIVGTICAFLCLAAWAVRSLSKSSPRSTQSAHGGHGVGTGSSLRASVSRSVTSVDCSTYLLTLSFLLFTAAAFIPGVLVGSATLTAWNAPFLPRWIADSDLPLICAHTARFGFVGLLAGWFLAARESPEQRDSRLLYAPGLRGWLTLRLAAEPTAPLGVALACAALSLHEIESTVLLQPPGSANLAQRLLDLLHYAKDEQLAAAAINLLTLGTLLAFAAAWLLTRASSSPPGGRTMVARDFQSLD